MSSWRNSAVKPFRSTSGHSDNVVVVVTAICPRAGASESAAACKGFYGIKGGIGGQNSLTASSMGAIKH